MIWRLKDSDGWFLLRVPHMVVVRWWLSVESFKGLLFIYLVPGIAEGWLVVCVISLWTIVVDNLDFVTVWWSQGSWTSYMEPGFCWGRSLRGCASCWPASWTWATRGSWFSPPSLECRFYPPFPQWESFSRMQAWESKVLLRSSGLNMWLNPAKASI